MRQYSRVDMIRMSEFSKSNPDLKGFALVNAYDKEFPELTEAQKIKNVIKAINYKVPSEAGLTYVCDDKRHLICVPYSIENLHIMAKELDIRREWYHNSGKPHYDIPKKRIDEITRQCKLVSSKEIVEIINHPEYGHIIIGDLTPSIGAVPSNQVLPEHEVLKYNGFSTKRSL